MDTSWMSLPRATTEYENVIKYGLIGRRLERISNVSGLLKATELHLLFPNHVKLLCWMLKMTCKGWCMMHSTGLVRTYMKMK
ncbi:hypothetical protein HanHA300_Chr17g0653991 [Helianthus annuus]|nr:hypothetical protein HanHA300_Chr17g0653991 [Helianthus annuus]KAJ0447498.1 hypothetical protein HanHA89_Chr17g0706081 [Helianthus annuus]KAJ0632374.1 hypothetical protein HanLR1_Chr17g0664441 [Helianthus annuus]